MKCKKARSQKWVFFEALVLAIFVFAIGIAFGFLIESWRINKIADIYTQSEASLLDLRLQSQIYDLSEIDCGRAIDENIAFADKVYEEAKILDRYEQAQRLGERLVLQHKKYDLLRVLFFLNSLKIKEKCNASYHTLLYFYEYNQPDLDKKAKQAVFSNILGEVKKIKGNEIMLIPIAGDLGLPSVDLLQNIYEVRTLPAIVIDEKTHITEIKTINDVLNKINNSAKNTS